VEVVEPEPVPAPAAHEQPLHSDGAELAAYALRVGDGVAITLRGIPQPEKIECQVDEYGMIPLPLINDVRAEGLSAAELQKTIRQIYLDRGIYKNINVTVLIPTRYYYTQGEFKSQGKFQLVSAITLSQAIAASGYFTDFASGKVLIRRNGVIFKTVRNARKLDRTPEDDILIEPNDIIEAVRSYF
jgi:protein involved in polysaccharide export with SLBB domain